MCFLLITIGMYIYIANACTCTCILHTCTHHSGCIVVPCTGALEVLLDMVVALEGKVVALSEEGHISQLSQLDLQ